jgi:hypothetical protein
MNDKVRFNYNIITFDPAAERPMISLDKDLNLESVCIEGYRMYPIGHILDWWEIWQHIKGRIRIAWVGNNG